jgi:hypothetical protein
VSIYSRRTGFVELGRGSGALHSHRKSINQRVSDAATAAHAAHQGPFVSLLLLHQLAQATLPVNLFSGEEVDRLRVLYLAGHVKATIPLPVRTLYGYDQPPATVEALTPLGERMLRRFPMRTPTGESIRSARAPRKRLLGRF